MNDKCKLYVLTGFLGAGKTTLLQSILKQLKGHKIGMIQNEFGKLGIDGEILRDDDIKMVEINRGSIFCSCLKLSFVQALADMSQYQFEYLFVESSGLGDPSNIEEIVSASEELAPDAYDYAGSICLVDAVHFMQQKDDLETVNRQLAHCHLAVLTKTDLVDENQISSVMEEVKKINPLCPIKIASKGNLPLDFLQENLLNYQWAEGEESTNTEETKPKTLFLECEEEVDQEKLERFLHQISNSAYRVKGFLKIAGRGLCQVDLVGNVVDIKECHSEEPDKITLISKVGPAMIRECIDSWEQLVQVPMKLRN